MRSDHCSSVFRSAWVRSRHVYRTSIDPFSDGDEPLCLGDCAPGIGEGNRLKGVIRNQP